LSAAAGTQATTTPDDIDAIAVHSRPEIESPTISIAHSAPATGTSADSTPTVWLPTASTA